MSLHAISWALNQSGMKSSQKFLLVCIADSVNDSTGLAFQCIKQLSEKTCQNRKTVLSNIQALQEIGKISDTGNRVGSTRQVIVYKLNMEPNNSPKKGTVSENEQSQNSLETVPFLPPNSPKIPSKQSQKRDTDPKIRKELRSEKVADAPRVDLKLHESLPISSWEEWISHRRARRFPCDSLTLAKHLKLLAEFETATQVEIIDSSINGGWQGLFRPKTTHKPAMNGKNPYAGAI